MATIQISDSVYFSLKAEKGKKSLMDAQLLQKSLNLIPDKTAFAQQFYTNLFRDFPETAQLFAHTDMKRQYSSLMGTIAFVVSGAQNGDNLLPALHNLGAKHAGYHVQADDYPKVGAALIDTFKSTLSTQFTPEMTSTWTQAFTFIAQEMQNGATSLA